MMQAVALVTPYYYPTYTKESITLELWSPHAIKWLQKVKEVGGDVLLPIRVISTPKVVCR